MRPVRRDHRVRRLSGIVGDDDQVEIARAANYYGSRMRVLLALAPRLLAELDRLGNGALFRDLEMPLVPVLAELEIAGVAVDIPYLQQVSRELYEQLQRLDAEIADVAHGPINVNSPQQLARFLFEDLGRFDESVVSLDKGIKIFGELGARWELADARAERGISKRELGRYDEAEDDLRYAIRASEELGERQLAGWTWRAFARVAEMRGDHAEAEKRYRRSQEAEARGPYRERAEMTSGQRDYS